MPIRINLKEIFPSDPQEINVEKVNFNFNKLLELGIGTPGPIGLTGPQGPAGPIGLTGPQGIRGATWWVDSGVPTTHVFPGLLIGDLYLDNTSFNVWRWDGTAWTLQVGISTIINTYLAANGSPFVKTIKSLPSRNIDGRFITFSEREDVNDLTRGASNTSKNYSLFLTNFDEEKVNLAPMPPIDWPPNVNALYNSIVSIFVNHADSQLSTAAELGRYHLELGSLYNDTVDTRISEVQHNLKIRYIKQYLTTPELPLTNEWINTAQFSLSVDEGRGISAIDQNGVFNFITPKLNIENPLNTVQDELNTRIGPWESHVEIPSLDYVRADGISFELLSSFLGANIGIAQTYDKPLYTRLNGQDLFMLDTNPSLLGILLDDNTYIIGNTNVIGKVSIGDIDPVSDLTVSGGASIGSGYNTIIAPINGAIIEGNLGVGTSSPSSKVQIVGGNALPATSGTTQTQGLRISTDTGVAVLDVGVNSAGSQTWIQSTDSTDLSYGADLLLNPNTGTVGIGTTSPDPVTTLHINGKTRITDGTEVAGTKAVLTTPGDGVSSWTPLTSIGVPVGAIVMWYATTAPPGWLVCDDRAVDPSYTVLTALVGSRTPDLRGTFVVGAGGGGAYSGGANYYLHQPGGVNSVTLNSSQIPAHIHGLASAAIPAHTHAFSGTTDCAAARIDTGCDANNNCGTRMQRGADNCLSSGDESQQPYGHRHTFSGTTACNTVGLTLTGTTDNTGGGGSHENRPPFFALTYIIKHD